MSSEQESDRPDMNAGAKSEAFEYVVGTLRGDARRRFEQHLQQQPHLEQEVRFWEQELMGLHQNTIERAPKTTTWSAIESAITDQAASAVAGSSQARPEPRPGPTHGPTHSPQGGFWSGLVQAWQGGYQSWQSGFVLFRPATLALLWALMATVWLVSAPPNPVAFTPDYVAVLTQPGSDQPLLTALTSSSGAELRLQWQPPVAAQALATTADATNHGQIAADVSWQLWAKSRRDGQIRSLLVFDQQQDGSLTLDEARLRLIRDAEDLILTQEEPGGSPIDEPSDQLLARGACVRLTLEAS